MDMVIEKRRGVVPGKIIAAVIVVFTEIMFFAGLTSTYLISRANQMSWPPDGQDRFPLEYTLINTAFLLISGIILLLGGKKEKEERKPYVIGAFVFGFAFFAMQGQEWARLIEYGMSGTESIYAAFFYMIIGAHAVHVLMGLASLAYLYKKLPSDDETMSMVQIFWQFVVWLWPVLYYMVYIY